jgi:hypothetical protein
MLPERRRMLEDEICPVPDDVLGELYRASSHGLAELVASVSPEVRGMLAIYCYRRAHLASVGLAIAASCDEDDLTRPGGHAGAVLFAKSREAPQAPRLEPHLVNRRKVTLASGPLRDVQPMDDDEDVEDGEQGPADDAAV